MRRSNAFIGVLFLASAALLFLFALKTIEPMMPTANVNATDARTTPDKPKVDFGNPQLGPTDAKVTIIEYGDYGCAPCADLHALLPDFLTEYRDRVRFVWKDLPNTSIHAGSDLAAEAARCAGAQGDFWGYHDLLFATQTVFTADNLATLAVTRKLDPTALRACLDGHTMTASVRRDVEEALRLGIDATPFMLINDRPVSGAVEYDQLKMLVDAELAKAQK